MPNEIDEFYKGTNYHKPCLNYKDCKGMYIPWEIKWEIWDQVSLICDKCSDTVKMNPCLNTSFKKLYTRLYDEQ